MLHLLLLFFTVKIFRSIYSKYPKIFLLDGAIFGSIVSLYLPKIKKKNFNAFQKAHNIVTIFKEECVTSFLNNSPNKPYQIKIIRK